MDRSRLAIAGCSRPASETDGRGELERQMPFDICAAFVLTEPNKRAPPIMRCGWREDEGNRMCVAAARRVSAALRAIYGLGHLIPTARPQRSSSKQGRQWLGARPSPRLLSLLSQLLG